MNGYLIPVRCAHCDGALSHVTSSKVCAGTEASAIAKCTRCSREWQLLVQIRAVPNARSEARAVYRHPERVA